MKYIDAEQLKAEIEREIESSSKSIKPGRSDEKTTFCRGEISALYTVKSLIDTLPEQEHPIYQLNQILLDWVREAKTDKEQEARFEAHKRFFELYDEYMMQEPEQPASEGLEEKDFVEEVRQYYSNNCTWDALKQPMLSIITRCARHFAEWGAAHLKR